MRHLSSGYDGERWTVATITVIFGSKVNGDGFGLVMNAPNKVTSLLPARAGVCGAECGV